MDFASKNLTAGQLNAIVKKLGGEEMALRFLRDELTVSEPIAKKLLNFVTTTNVSEVTSFIVKDKFREGKTTDGVKIAWLGSNFKENFLGKTERGIASATLRIQKLTKDSLDAPILTELGDTAETTLAQLWELMKLQGSGQEGKLLVNGWANIVYIRDKNENLWAVYARWSSGSDGWVVGAYSVESPGRWGADFQVVSR
ncbi:MAG: hypothetical protein WCS97_01940 [Candidatus Paceibacterota bacterium]|jgi:hypothetical protein